MSRQNYYKQRYHRRRREVDEELILSLVRRERAVQPQLGARKLLHILGGELKSAGASVGRDRFFSILGRSSLLIKRRIKGCRTTESRHRFRVYGNLLKDFVLTSPHQALVSDITYIRTDEGFMYLSLVNGNFTVHTFRKTCAQNWADWLPANVVKFFLGHNNLNTTNRFYSIVDDSHMVWTKQAMDKMLKSGKESAFDTEQTLRHKNNQKPNAKKEANNVAPSVTPSKISTSNEHKTGRYRT